MATNRGSNSLTAEDRECLREATGARFQASLDVPVAFFEENADRVSQACWDMARRFHRGGRMLVFGNGASVSDAQHVSVEFVHPILVGKRALPAIALPNDVATVLGLAQAVSWEEVFSRQLETLGRPEDIAMGISPDGRCRNVLLGLERAKAMGMLTLALAGGDAGDLAKAACVEHVFVVGASDPLTVQEVHETLYHVLWELVHVFFEHKGLLGE